MLGSAPHQHAFGTEVARCIGSSSDFAQRLRSFGEWPTMLGERLPDALATYNKLQHLPWEGWRSAATVAPRRGARDESAPLRERSSSAHRNRSSTHRHLRASSLFHERSARHECTEATLGGVRLTEVLDPRLWNSSLCHRPFEIATPFKSQQSLCRASCASCTLTSLPSVRNSSFDSRGESSRSSRSSLQPPGDVPHPHEWATCDDGRKLYGWLTPRHRDSSANHSSANHSSANHSSANHSSANHSSANHSSANHHPGFSSRHHGMSHRIGSYRHDWHERPSGGGKTQVSPSDTHFFPCVTSHFSHMSRASSPICHEPFLPYVSQFSHMSHPIVFPFFSMESSRVPSS